MTKRVLPSEKVRSLGPYLFARIDELKRQASLRGREVLDFSMGNPDLPTPPHIVERLCEAVRERPATHRYPASRGMPVFRQAVCQWYQRRFGVRLDPEREALALIGSKEGIAHFLMAWLDPGDVALVCMPCYMMHFNGVLLAGGRPHPVPLEEKNGWLPDLAKIPEKVARRAKVFLFNFPNNPTGATADPAFFKEVVRFCRRYGILACHDNAYSEITFDGYEAPSFLQTPGAKEVGVEFHSLSKTYNMPGWRIGFAVGNSAILKPAERFKSYVDYGIFMAAQLAGVEALSGPQDCVAQTREIYRRRRDAMTENLRRIGWEVPSPKATFYLWARIPEKFRRMGSVRFSERLLQQTGVAVSPGAGFGPPGEGYVRIALVADESRFAEAAARIQSFLEMRTRPLPGHPRAQPLGSTRVEAGRQGSAAGVR